LLSFAIHKVQGTHTDLSALLDEKIIGVCTTPQQLTYEVGLLDETLKSSIHDLCKDQKKNK
jgi:hypothetical protein